MTDADLRYHLEDKRKAPTQQMYRGPEGQSSGTPMKCFNYGDEGHHWSVCERPPLCYSCHDTGHKSTNCPKKDPQITSSSTSQFVGKGLQLCAFGLPGQLFYSLNLPEPIPTKKNVGEEPIRVIVSVLEGRGTRQRITTEFQYLMDST